jgi:hypothetical protein
MVALYCGKNRCHRKSAVVTGHGSKSSHHPGTILAEEASVPIHNGAQPIPTPSLRVWSPQGAGWGSHTLHPLGTGLPHSQGGLEPLPHCRCHSCFPFQGCILFHRVAVSSLASVQPLIDTRPGPRCAVSRAGTQALAHLNPGDQGVPRSGLCQRDPSRSRHRLNPEG